MERDSYFCDIVTDPLGFPTQLSVSLCLLPVLHGRFESNVQVCDYQHCTKQRYKLHRCDIFERPRLEMVRRLGRSINNVNNGFVHFQDDGQNLK